MANPKVANPEVAEPNKVEVNKPTKTVIEEVDADLEALKAEYVEVFEKQPNHLMKSKGLRKAIDAFKSTENEG